MGNRKRPQLIPGISTTRSAEVPEHLQESTVFQDTQTVVITRPNQVSGTVNRRFGHLRLFRPHQINDLPEAAGLRSALVQQI
jgi:hypothetical protein